MDIKPYEKNAKKHPDKQLKQIAASLKEFGWQQPIVVDKNGVIIVGHGRWAAYKKYPEGIKEPRIEVADLTEQQAKAYRLADNKLNESDWQMDLAIEELKGLDVDMVELTGFDTDLLLEPDAKDDDIPENVPPVAKLGDLWQLGRHRLLCGDATKIEDVERLMDGKKADMVFTDPPYELDTKGGGILKDAKSMQGIRELGIDKFSPDSLISRAKTEVFCCNKPLVKKYLDLAESWNKPYDICFYKKKNTAPNYGGHMMTDTEYIILIGEQSPNKGLPKETYSKCFIGEKDQDNKIAWSKPIALIEKFLMLYSKSEEIVVDTFLGTGSTLIACEKIGRNCYGMEMDEHYCDVIIKRFEDYTGIKATKIDGEQIQSI